MLFLLPTFSVSLLLTSQISVYLQVLVTSVLRVFSSTFLLLHHSLFVSPHAFASTLLPLLPPVSFVLHAFSSKQLHLLPALSFLLPRLGLPWAVCPLSLSLLRLALGLEAKLIQLQMWTRLLLALSYMRWWLLLSCLPLPVLFRLLGNIVLVVHLEYNSIPNFGFWTLFFRLSCTFMGCPAFRSPSSKTNLLQTLSIRP